jgi:predicted RNA binding protein YcfA (HicA-like mRNA interferase family)
MPRLRRLTGHDAVRIFQQLGFDITRIRGSHHILRRVVGSETQTINIPVHGSTPLAPGMLKRLYRDALRYIPEETLKVHFYSD